MYWETGSADLLNGEVDSHLPQASLPGAGNVYQQTPDNQVYEFENQELRPSMSATRIIPTISRWN